MFVCICVVNIKRVRFITLCLFKTYVRLSDKNSIDVKRFEVYGTKHMLVKLIRLGQSVPSSNVLW